MTQIDYNLELFWVVLEIDDNQYRSLSEIYQSLDINDSVTLLKCGRMRPILSSSSQERWLSLSFLVLWKWRHVTKILIKMHPSSTDGAILILVFPDTARYHCFKKIEARSVQLNQNRMSNCHFFTSSKYEGPMVSYQNFYYNTHFFSKQCYFHLHIIVHVYLFLFWIDILDLGKGYETSFNEQIINSWYKALKMHWWTTYPSLCFGWYIYFRGEELGLKHRVWAVGQNLVLQ